MQEQEDTVTPVLKQQLQQCETEIRNVMKAIRQGILMKPARHRMDETGVTETHRGMFAIGG